MGNIINYTEWWTNCPGTEKINAIVGTGEFYITLLFGMWKRVDFK